RPGPLMAPARKPRSYGRIRARAGHGQQPAHRPGAGRLRPWAGRRGRSRTPAQPAPRRAGRALLLGHDVGDPRGIGLAGLGLVELAVPLAVLVLVLPVDADLRVAGLVEQLADLGHRPHPPLVRERILQLGAVRELEVDVAEHAVRDRV